eukprot:6214321-Pleurochrysis_carterae.AAC.6
MSVRDSLVLLLFYASLPSWLETQTCCHTSVRVCSSPPLLTSRPTELNPSIDHSFAWTSLSCSFFTGVRVPSAFCRYSSETLVLASARLPRVLSGSFVWIFIIRESGLAKTP